MDTFYCGSVSLGTKIAIGVERAESYCQFHPYLCNFMTFMTEVVRILRRYGDDAGWGRNYGIFFQVAEGENE